MLVDIIEPVTVDERMARIAAIVDGPVELKRLDRGMYRGGFNATNILREVIKNEYPFEPLSTPEGWNEEDWRKEMFRRIMDETYPNDYGVVDYPQQLIEKFPRIVEDDRPFIVTFSEVRRDPDSGGGGWRWHKWGPYYGDKDPQCEYLDDEPEIDAVWTYAISEVKEGTYHV